MYIKWGLRSEIHIVCEESIDVEKKSPILISAFLLQNIAD